MSDNKNEVITSRTVADLIEHVARKQSTVFNTDGSPSYAYQVGYLSGVVDELLDKLSKDQLRVIHQSFVRRSEMADERLRDGR